LFFCFFLFSSSVFSFYLAVTGYPDIWGSWALAFLQISSRHEQLEVLADLKAVLIHPIAVDL